MKRIGLVLALILCFVGVSHATVTSTVNKNTYSCDGSNKTFDYTFPIISSTDIQLWLTDTTGSTSQVTSGFTVNTSTEQVTYPTTGDACVSGERVTLVRSVPLTQTTVLTTHGPFPASTINSEHDKLTMMAQQLQEQINRAVLAPINQDYSTGSLQFPDPVAYGYIGWDDDGELLTNYVLQNLSTTATPTFANVALTGLNGIVKAAGSTLTVATADTDYTTPNGTETFTNKTYDTSGTGNVFKVAGTTLGATGKLGSGKIVLASALSGTGTTIGTVTGTPVSGNCAKWDANGNLIDNGSTCSGGTGMTYPASSGIVTTDSSSWTTPISGTSSQFVKGDGSLDSTEYLSGLINSAGINWTDIRNIDPTTNINWTDLTGLVKAGSGTVTSASSGTDYAPATSGTSILKGNGSGGFSSASSGTDYAPATSGSAILYGNGSGGFANVTIGTGLQFTGGSLSNTDTLPSQTGNSGKYLTTNGTSTSWNNVLPTWVSSQGQQIGEATTERFCNDGTCLCSTYKKMKEISLYGSGSVNVSFNMKSLDTNQVHGRIYRNGVAVGTDQIMSSTSYSTYSETISGSSNGDLIQVYACRAGSGVYIDDLKIYGSQMDETSGY